MQAKRAGFGSRLPYKPGPKRDADCEIFKRSQSAHCRSLEYSGVSRIIPDVDSFNYCNLSCTCSHAHANAHNHFTFVLNPLMPSLLPSLCPCMRSFMKVRLDRVLRIDLGDMPTSEVLKAGGKVAEFKKPEKWTAPYAPYSKGWWEPFIPTI